MSLDPRFIPATYFQQYFVNKLDGTPLSGGRVEFYSDASRSTPKNVYELVDVPSYPTYTSLGSVLLLSIQGTFVDGGGNDVAPYFFPYDNTPDTSSDDVENYYIIVKDSNGVTQFTREGVPNNSQDNTSNLNHSINYIPNGQFRTNNSVIGVPLSIPGTDFTYPGLYTLSVTDIAQGGFTFERSSTSTATDSVSFLRNTNISENPNNSPRYSCLINRSVATAIGDSICDFRIKFFDVHKFQQTPITFAFTALTPSGSFVVDLYVIQYYGDDGSNSVENLISGGTFSISTTSQAFSVSFTLEDAVGTVGTKNNDFVQIAIRFPHSVGQTFNVQIDDIYLALGNIQIKPGAQYFPITTDGQFYEDAISSTQAPNDLYLPIYMTQNGFDYDRSSIGKIYSAIYQNPVGNELLCDGSQYLTLGVSSLGIPYSRLQSVLFNSASNIPVFGTGSNYRNAYITNGNQTKILLCTNKSGSQTQCANGSTSPGFSYSVNTVGASANAFYARSNANGWINIRALFTGDTVNSIGFVDGGGSHATGLTFIGLRIPQASDPIPGQLTENINSVIGTNFVGTSGSNTNTKYFTFNTNTTSYYMWFNTTGELDPAPGGTGIEVFVDPSMSSADTAACIVAAFNGYQMESITCIAASGIPDGSYFTFWSNGIEYSPWYRVGSGTASAPSQNPIKITLVGTETAIQVASLTQKAINELYFAVPDLRGMFLRGLDTTPLLDIDTQKRYSFASNIANVPGTFEFDDISMHGHRTGGGGDIGTDFFKFDSASSNRDEETSFNGGSESRPYNMSVNYFIKY
jgi:hypothetical protein